MTDATSPDLLPMREVVSLTGINPVTLRAWERRHGLIRPQRTEGGHRLYTPGDVQRIRDILHWTGNGLPISKVGELLAQQRDSGFPSSGLEADDFEHWRAGLLRATQAFDGQALEALHGQLFTLYPKARVVLDVLLPVWRELSAGQVFGQRSQWLFLDTFLRARLLLRLQMNQAAGQCVLLAGIEGSAELELLCSGLLLSGERKRIEVLSGSQPLAELPLLCSAMRPGALVLLLQGPVNKALASRLRSLQMEIDCPLALMGREISHWRDALTGVPLALLEEEGGDVGVKLDALLGGALEL